MQYFAVWNPPGTALGGRHSGRNAVLTDSKLKALEPAAKTCRVADGGGLYVKVIPSGRKVGRQTFRFAGKPRTHTHGTGPDVRLADARLPGVAWLI